MSEETHERIVHIVNIPMEIVASKSLSPTEKLLFGVIHVLSQRRKGCTATNAYLAKELNCTEWTIRMSIASLTNNGFLDVTYTRSSMRTMHTIWDCVDTRSQKITAHNEDSEGGVEKSTPPEKPQNDSVEKSTGGVEKSTSDKRNNYNSSSNYYLTPLQSLNNTSSEPSTDSKESGSLVRPEGSEQDKAVITRPKIQRDVDPVPKDRSIYDRIKHPVAKEKPVYHPSQLAEAVMSFWSESGLVRHREGTKTYEESCRMIEKLSRGTLFKGTHCPEGFNRLFTRKDFIVAIKNFALAALNLDYEPTNSYKDHLAKTSLKDFLYNPYCSSKENISLFLKYLSESPKLVKNARYKAIEDFNPQNTKRLTKWYCKKVLGVNSREFDAKEMNCFIQATNRIKEIADRYEGKIQNKDTLFVAYGVASVFSLFATMFIYCMERQLEKGKVPIHYLCNDLTFDSIFPEFLKFQGVVR